ncbi:MarR family transcriptional regulator [Ensifer sp. ENS04]|nr:MarR family transcriptional regulator [Ensifer sp. ENS04]
MDNRTRRADEQLNNRIFFRLFQLGNILHSQSIRQLGITTVQWAVLGALSRSGSGNGVSITELADYLIVSRQNLNGVLNRLERSGLLERTQNAEDRRARLVRLTLAGTELWSELQEPIYQFYSQASSGFSLDDQAAIAHYLNQLELKLLSVKIDGGTRHSLADDDRV